MKLNKTVLSTAVATALTGAIAMPAQAAVIDMDYSGLFTMLTPTGTQLQNTSFPYYGDPTWGYGLRTQISGTMQINTSSGFGTVTVNPFEFYDKGRTYIYDFSLQSIGGNLMIGNLTWNFGSSLISSQLILDASGLISELPGSTTPGGIYDASTCTVSGACALPASDGIKKGKYPIGPVPIATTSFNTTGQTGYGTTLGQLSLGTDDGIGGSPMDHGPFSGFSNNIDFTSLTVVTYVSTVPVPAAVWLFGSGLLGLIGVGRRRKPR